MSEPTTYPDGTPLSVAKRTTLSELCKEWARSEADIRQAFGLIHEAEARLEAVLGGDSRNLSIQSHGSYLNFAEPDDALSDLKRSVWAALADRMELRTMMSLARVRELDEQIKTGEGLPPMDYTSVLATLITVLDKRNDFLKEKVHECYQWLRPAGWHRTDYKTNQKSAAAGVGMKVILTYACSRSYQRNSAFEISYGSRDRFRAIDQVFHLLDGKEQPRSHNGELCDAVVAQTSGTNNTFETEYFRGRCFANQNVHLEFRREDLVGKFNLLAGGANLKEAA